MARLQVHTDVVIKQERCDPGRLPVTDRIAATSVGDVAEPIEVAPGDDVFRVTGMIDLRTAE